MARILGIDPGASATKAVLLETSFRGVSFVGRREISHKEVEDSGFDFSEVASALKASGMANADQIVVALPGTKVSTQHMSLPFTDQKRIAATLGFEVESAIPYDIAETAWDHQVISTSEGKSELIVGSTRLQEVQSFLDALKSAGLDPRVVTSSAMAYQNLVAASFSKDASRSRKSGLQEKTMVEGVLDVGHERCSLSICRGSDLICARTFPGGGKDLMVAVAKDFDVSLPDAQAWLASEADMNRREGDGPQMDRAREALRHALAPMIREIRSTLRSCSARFHASVDRLHLTGGVGQLKGLDEFFTSELGVEVVPMSLPTADDFHLTDEDGPRFALATSLALQGCGGLRSHRFNLRTGALAFKGDLDFLKGKASRLGIFALVLAVLAGISMGLQWRNVKAREKAVDEELFEMTKKVLGQGQKNYDIALNMLKGSGTVGGQLPAQSAVDIFGDLVASAQKVDVKLEEVDAQMDRVKFRGETAGFEGVDMLVAQLESVACFREVKRNKVQKSKDGAKIIFELDIRVSCDGSSNREGKGR